MKVALKSISLLICLISLVTLAANSVSAASCGGKNNCLQLRGDFPGTNGSNCNPGDNSGRIFYCCNDPKLSPVMVGGEAVCDAAVYNENRGTLPQCVPGQAYDIGSCSCVCDGNGPDPSRPLLRTCINPTEMCGTQSPTEQLSQSTLDSLNPLKIPEFLDSSIETGDLSTPRGILNRVLQFAFPIAGLVLFVMLVWAGFEIVAGATEKKSLDAGRQRATAAIIGFILLFVSYWIIQVLQTIFNLSII